MKSLFLLKKHKNSTSNKMLVMTNTILVSIKHGFNKPVLSVEILDELGTGAVRCFT